jgi:D-amino-acid dehydrogenase
VEHRHNPTVVQWPDQPSDVDVVSGTDDDVVVVIGAGIIGLASALELANRGRRVIVVDRGQIDGGCAVGSAGHLVPSHVVPLAAPGALAIAVAGLVRRRGALSVKWSLTPSFWRWIIRFVRSCTTTSMESAAPALRDLARLSDETWDEWLAASGEPVRCDGLFDVYSTRRSFDGARRHADELRRWGVAVEEVDAARALAMEPALREPVAGGVLLPGDRSVHPATALAGVIARAGKAGVVLRPCAEVVDIVSGGDRVIAVRTAQGDIAASHVVVAAGAWSAKVARLFGERIPMLAGRGLSLTVAQPAVGPRRPMLLGEDHVAVAPIGDELRLSAWFQLNNFDTGVTAERIARLEEITRRRVQLDSTLHVRRRWAGLRPVTPDGVPIIGPAPSWRNVTIASGHAMTGLTLGPGTGLIVAQLVCGEPTDIVVDRFSPRRF